VLDGVLPTPIRRLDTSHELAVLLDTFQIQQQAMDVIFMEAWYQRIPPHGCGSLVRIWMDGNQAAEHDAARRQRQRVLRQIKLRHHREDHVQQVNLRRSKDSGKCISPPAHGHSTSQGRGSIIDNEYNTQYNGGSVATRSEPYELQYGHRIAHW